VGELWSYPDLFPGVGGGGRCFGATNGHALNSYSPPRRMIPAVRRRTTDASSKRFSESCAPVAHVATCPQNWVIGTGHICAPRAGSKRVSGSAWQPHLKAMLTWSNCSSTRSSCAPTSIPPAPKKSGPTGNQSLARRTDHQAACRDGCLWQSHEGSSLGRTDRRHRAGRGVDSGSAGRIHRGRQGLRFGCIGGSHYPARQPCGHPASFPQAHPTSVRPAYLQEPQPDRASIQPYQAIRTHCHPPRQNRQVLHVICSSGLRYRLARWIENAP